MKVFLLLTNVSFATFCTTDDLSVWRGNQEFSDNVAKFALSSFGRCAATVSKIILAYPTLSLACANCFGETVACGTRNCWMACIVDPFAERCIECSARNCRGDFLKCSGFFNEADWPLPPSATGKVIASSTTVDPSITADVASTIDLTSSVETETNFDQAPRIRTSSLRSTDEPILQVAEWERKWDDEGTQDDDSSGDDDEAGSEAIDAGFESATGRVVDVRIFDTRSGSGDSVTGVASEVDSWDDRSVDASWKSEDASWDDEVYDDEESEFVMVNGTH